MLKVFDASIKPRTASLCVCVNLYLVTAVFLTDYWMVITYIGTELIIKIYIHCNSCS